MMIRKIAPCPAALLAAVLSLSSCTTGFVKTEPIPGDPGRAREITRTCNWKDTGQWLNPVEAPNSPFLPFNRGSRFSFGMDVMAVVATLGISLVGDLFISPLAYAFNRDCKETERAVSAPSGKPPSAGAASPEPARPASEPVITDKPANRPVYRPKADPLAYAILIGIGRYRGVAEVPYARFDQESARMVFWKAFGVPEENIRSLGDSFATKSDIDVALNTWLPRELARLKGRKARVYVYYSGHGISDPASRAAYLLPFDGRPEAPLETAVPLSEVYKALAHPSIEAGLVVARFLLLGSRRSPHRFRQGRSSPGLLCGHAPAPAPHRGPLRRDRDRDRGQPQPREARPVHLPLRRGAQRQGGQRPRQPDLPARALRVRPREGDPGRSRARPGADPPAPLFPARAMGFQAAGRLPIA